SSSQSARVPLRWVRLLVAAGAPAGDAREQLGTAVDAELPVEGLDVLIDGQLADPEARRDFLVRLTVEDRLERLALARREMWWRLDGLEQMPTLIVEYLHEIAVVIAERSSSPRAMDRE